MQAAGRVDFGTDLNDPVRHPDSSYLHVERTLAQLEALTGVPPKCLEQFKDLYGYVCDGPTLGFAACHATGGAKVCYFCGYVTAAYDAAPGLV